MTQYAPDMSLSVLKGISAARMKLFKKLEIETLGQLVSHYPRAYEDRGNIKKAGDATPGETASFLLEIVSPPKSAGIPARGGKRPLTIQKLHAADETGSIRLVFFNQNYLSGVFLPGRKFRFYGQVSGTFLNPALNSPDYEPFYEDIPLDYYVPIYPLTNGLTRKMIQSAVKQTLSFLDADQYDPLPSHIREDHGLCARSFALQNIHFPESLENLTVAKRRLAFEELYAFQYRLLTLRNREKQGVSHRFFYPDMKRFTAKLPFVLTRAQKLAIQDILIDMTGAKQPFFLQDGTDETIPPARRLIQGDVGSGKTVVAAAAIYAAAQNKKQSALMVPTGILAEQHDKELSALLGQFGVRTALLTGGTKAAEKRRILSELVSGEIDLVIGTHALIEENVAFETLSLVITDEQHRFGVRQRDRLAEKARRNEDELHARKKPHMIVMSATPIPRTLAMILYGDLDISIIDELPPGRKKIDTFAVGEEMRPRVYQFIRKQIKNGRQAYVVCPLIENTLKEDEYIPYLYEGKHNMKSAIEYAQFLQEEIFRECKVSLLHGKMKPAQKDQIMRDFVLGNTDILVSTTVIEVGVNVPNAALMVVENAERFGLSQLHQLRGRVGRGAHQSYCILISPLLSGENKDAVSTRRLRIMCETESGFQIAQSDLELRGPGEFFGKRQHGELKFKMADIAADMDLLEETKKAAEREISK